MFYVLSHIFQSHPEFSTLTDAVEFVDDCGDDLAAIYTLDDSGQPVYVEIPR